MKARTYYILVLSIYAALWSCQMFVCNSTHSLIVLTDSYINLYYMIEIALELVYMRIQSKLSSGKKVGKKTYRFLNRGCTYQFARLPLLGSFMNSVFLSALLMYAAIEGIQSCFHAHHLINEAGKPIILQQRLIYPGLLAGFACLGTLMRVVVNSVNKIRDEENDLRKQSSSTRKCEFVELDCNTVGANLATIERSGVQNDARASIHSNGDIAMGQLSKRQNNQSAQVKNGVVLKSYKTNPESNEILSSVCLSVENTNGCVQPITLNRPTIGGHNIKHFVSPIALMICATILFSIMDDKEGNPTTEYKELVTEIADAILAIAVVVVAYIASYSSMNHESRLLLQSAPINLDLDSLTADLKSISPLVTSVDDLHVWTLDGNNTSIGSCNLLIPKSDVAHEPEITNIVRNARLKFSERGIRCSCVQPVLFSLNEDGTDDEGQKRDE